MGHHTVYSNPSCSFRSLTMCVNISVPPTNSGRVFHLPTLPASKPRLWPSVDFMPLCGAPQNRRLIAAYNIQLTFPQAPKWSVSNKSIREITTSTGNPPKKPNNIYCIRKTPCQKIDETDKKPTGTGLGNTAAAFAEEPGLHSQYG